MPFAPSPQAAACLQRARLYLCTDSRGASLRDFEAFADAVYAAGVDIIQLRDKGMEAAKELDYFAVLRESARRHGALFSANDRADIARLAGADILHLGQGDLPLPAARGLLAEGALLGQSTHDIGQARRAMQSEADYYCIGPVWPTPTKPGRPAAGLQAVREVADAARELAPAKPWFAIGDINLNNIGEVIEAGARRIVVVRAITQAPDPAEATARLKAALPPLD
ncbi:thiamine phosphate synthase [Corticibacter populi]|uniref:Thiamine-phosphate synthase n=1 Tax=Corticibacter populi TaxID=1550736 RepID=A0A3M6QSB5_9BURK|nr:thiamine phosphate synthase [Corticibacter populi]RMX05883.1 thiamine phosphate synthase [Corticibacter populi]RZS30798.1 thiamine-phosphate pyrophosphorylase [Corticibacter populi]